MPWYSGHAELDFVPLLIAVFLAALGACWGSFAATLSDRWPQGRSIVRPGSHCEQCARPLSARDLIPVVSYALARGRCRHCKAPISARYPLFEIAAAGVGALSALLVPWPDCLWVALLGWQLLLLAVLDAEHFWLPDPLVAVLAGSGICASLLSGGPQFADAVIGAAAGFAALFAIATFYKRTRGRTGMGGGDPKLFGAIGAWIGWQGLPLVLLMAAMIGIGVAGWMASRDTKGAPLLQRRLPFGTCLAVSAWVWYLFNKVNLTVIPLISTMSQN